MTIRQQIITILFVVLGTMTTRFLPFIIFPEDKEPPKYVLYLGKVLPYAVIGLLVVYCIKDSFYFKFHGIPEVISIIAVTLIHRWKRNTLISIAGGTALYMFLVQFIFV